MKKIYIISERIKDKSSYSDGLILTEKDFDPCKSFFEVHPNIKPESIDYIYTKGILEDFEYLRCFLKNIDGMLACGGTFEVDYFHLRLDGCAYAVRPEDEVAYEIAEVFKDRLLLQNKLSFKKDNFTNRKYKKNAHIPCYNDGIDKWSFGIVSNGTKNERILEIINRIESFHIPYFEIIICGPSQSQDLPPHVRVLGDEFFYDDTRIPLCKKKNEIIRNSVYPNLVIIHDRITFEEDWYQQMKKHGFYFDCIAPSILDEETRSYHVIDFPKYSDIVFGKYTPISFENKWDYHLYMDGAVIIMKTRIAKEIMLKEYLHWGEKEDVDFCKRITQNGYFIEVDHCVVMLSSVCKSKSLNNSLWKKIKTQVSYLVKWPIRYRREKNKFINEINKQ